jgi:hypothetical protein
VAYSADNVSRTSWLGSEPRAAPSEEGGGRFASEVTSQGRRVRVTDEQPSATDFLVIELPAAVERFATGFGLLMTDESIEIIGVGSGGAR